MRAPLLLIPLAALAAASIGFGPQSAQDLNATTEDLDAAANAVEAAADAAEAAVGNVTEAAAQRPAWLSNGMWLRAGEQDEGPVWYFEPFESDFSALPYRVLIRVDETPDPARTHNNSLRVAEIDCAAHRYRILGTTHYDDAGRASEANERGDGSLVPAVPGSVFAAVEETVCRHARGREEANINGQ